MPLFAVCVKLVAARYTQRRLQRPGRVIKPGMDDFRVPAAGVCANGRFGFKHDDVVAGHRQLARDSYTDNAGADDDAVDPARFGQSGASLKLW